MAKLIPVPAEAVRTREQILAEPHILVFANRVWTTCWNCGGHGTYPSSCTPSGMCRLYCWALAGDPVADAMGAQRRSRKGTKWEPTYGKLPHDIDKYVKQQQANDRRRYREQVRFEQERPEREAREAAAKAEHDAKMAVQREMERRAEEMNNERLAMIAAEKAKRQHIGQIGERLDLTVVYESFRRIPGTGSYGWQAQTRYLFRFRDQDGNLLILWTAMPPCNVKATGKTFQLRGTVKEHSTFDGEAQTVIQRVKLTQELANVG